jgi:hypothetical protein
MAAQTQWSWNPTFMGQPLFGPQANSSVKPEKTEFEQQFGIPYQDVKYGAPGTPPSIRGLTPGDPYNLSNLGLNEDLGPWLERLLSEQEKGQQFNIEQRDKGVNILGDFGKTVETALPLNPYSDQMREAVLARSNDLITQMGQANFAQATTNLSRRGFTGTDTNAQTAAGGIQADILGQRIGAETKTLLDQAGFNQMSNLAREDLLKQITAGQAQIQAGNVVDPEAYANTLSNALGIQLSEENKDEFMAYIQTLEPGVLERIMQTLPAAGSAFFPGGPVAQFAFNAPNLLVGNG